MTLKEIAVLAGVSVSTVSRIINSPDDSFARKEVRERVWAIIKETGYVPNQSARALKLKQNRSASSNPYTLTCILGRTKTLEDNPFFAQVARSIEQQALNLGCCVCHSYSIFDVDSAGLQLRTNTPETDGAIVLGRFSAEAMSYIDKHYRNKVYVGRNVMDCNWDQVICDGYSATKIALEYLISCGHKRIGYLGESVNEVRYQAFSDMVTKHGLDSDGNLVCRCQQNGDGGYMGADKMIKQAKPLPTAIFCATDITAIAAVRRFSEEGIKIPSQLSVISMDNIELSAYVSPMLTTVEMPIVELGNIAVQTLLDRINKRHRLPMKIFLPNKLMIRESVVKYPAST
ncbi:LacI family transcriptional regulator [Aminipila butyrica]|uniref:LacI family transcriptional regulator n=1 Tax=Aminipila butyrica TaxID=433296 RepID=A0A858BWL3_9FIRM|nr:LacI family DNA-binding transcriptional regulator [Aminipila butyrica]QIB70471.1 LacI family transcriptional regulator [Aminipila butyrica]